MLLNKEIKPKDIFYKAVFWDAKFEELDFEDDKNFIISRILTKGTDKDIYFVCDYYDKKTILFVLKTTKGIDPAIINYFEQVL
jgi:hypothetical protein